MTSPSCTRNPLDHAAINLLQALTHAEIQPGIRARRAVDVAVRALQQLTARRVRGLILRYGLGAMSDDAQQTCLIALVDAARRWDPARSSFATWLGWHLRGVLVGLRRQWCGDDRTASGRQRVATLSLDHDMDTASASDWLIDPGAEDGTARAAADWLAIRCADRLVADCDDRTRAALFEQLLDDGPRELADRRTLALLRQRVH